MDSPYYLTAEPIVTVEFTCKNCGEPITINPNLEVVDAKPLPRAWYHIQSQNRAC